MIAAPLDLAGWLLALLLPWCLGIAIVRWLLCTSARRNLPLLIGHGFFVGLFAVTLLMRLWDAAGLALDFTPLAVTVAGITLSLALVQVRWPGVPVMPTGQAPPAARAAAWQRALIVVLLALLTWRYATLLQELLLRPLYAWDAWMNWAPKAMVWFHHRELVEFVSPEQWAQQSGAELYTLGNRQAWDYPMSVPLILLWFMLGLGTADHSAIYLAWWLVPLCLAIAFWGHLRLAGASGLLIAVCCYLLLSMPYVNVHSALAGYADIWQAAAFALGVCALYEWRRQRHWNYALLVLLTVALCAQLKMPGIVLGLILLAGMLREWLALGWRRELWLVALGAALVTAMAMTGVAVDIPYLGRFALDTQSVHLGALVESRLAIHPVAGPFLETFAVMINWNLLGFLLPPFLLYALWWHRRTMRGVTTEVLVVLLACAFVSSVFVFTGYYTQAINFMALNRALVYPIPALLFVCAVHFPASRHCPASSIQRA